MCIILNYVNDKVDDRANMRPGAKYFEWERKGVPLRIELGPRDLAEGSCVIAQRHSAVKGSMALNDDLITTVKDLLNSIHEQLLAAATKRVEENTVRLNSYEEMKRIISATNRASGDDTSLAQEGEVQARQSNNEDTQLRAGFYLVPWADNAENEEAIKTECKATIRCYPFIHNISPPPEGTKCFYSNLPATHMALFARAF